MDYLGDSKQDEKPKDQIIKMGRYRSTGDAFIYRVAIITLSVVAVLGVLTMFFLAVKNVEIPQAITAISSASIGALGALFNRQ